jgi:hypothetical protein
VPSGLVSSARLAWACIGLAVLLHAWLLFGREGLWGGGDLVPHLRLIQAVSTSPGLYNPYAPAYHWLGALLVPALGFELYTRLFALGAALFLIAGFRSFQRAAGLPDACTALFALTPFLLSLSWCVPRVEAAGYALLLFGLGFQLRGRYFALAAALGACFYVHTAASLLFGLAAGVLALARRDRRALIALAAGTLGALPLWIAHLEAGCTFAQALLFAPGGYARSLDEELLPPQWPWLAALANPAALLAAVLGARAVWRRSRPLAWLAVALAALWATNFWLAPFGIRTLVTPLRGLSVLAIPVALSAGVWGAARARREAVLLGLTAIFAVASLRLVVPQACYVRPIALSEIDGVFVSRCEFLWRAAPREAPAPASSGAAVRLSGAASGGVVFVRRGPQGRELWRARLSDGAERRLLADEGHDELWPFWSSAAGKLLFQSERIGGESALLMLLDPGSGRVAPLVSPRAWREHWAAWSPDGTRVAYVFVSRPGPRATRGVAEVEIASGRRSVLTPDPEGRVAFFRPEYAPDGRRLLIQRRGQLADSSSELWLLEPGHPLRALPGRFPSFAEKARFSPDGASIVYTGRESPEGPGDVWLVRPDGSGSRPIAAEPEADENSAHFSPTRGEIAFISDRDGSPDLFLLDLASGAARNLTRTPGRPERAPRWSPDGDRIALSVLPAAAGDERDPADERVVVVGRDGKLVLDIPGEMPDWMPPWPDSP